MPGYCTGKSWADRDTGWHTSDGKSHYFCDESTGVAEWFVDDGRCCPRSVTLRAASTFCRTDDRPKDCIAIVSGYPNDVDDTRNRCVMRPWAAVKCGGGGASSIMCTDHVPIRCALSCRMAAYRSGLPMQLVYTDYRTEVPRLEAINKPVRSPRSNTRTTASRWRTCVSPVPRSRLAAHSPLPVCRRVRFGR